MTQGQSFWPIALLMFATGIGIPILATLNAGLGHQLNNAPTATFVLLGQMVAAATIDHFGLWGALKTTLTPRRAVGILIMAIGLYLARKPV